MRPVRMSASNWVSIGDGVVPPVLMAWATSAWEIAATAAGSNGVSNGPSWLSTIETEARKGAASTAAKVAAMACRLQTQAAAQQARAAASPVTRTQGGAGASSHPPHTRQAARSGSRPHEAEPEADDGQRDQPSRGPAAWPGQGPVDAAVGIQRQRHDRGTYPQAY